MNAQQAVAYLQQVLTTEEFEDITEEFHYVGTPFLLAWPNPSNEYMFIAGNGIATIYDMMGRLIKTLLNGSQTAGHKNIKWNATNDKNERVSAGLYLYKIESGNNIQTMKMILLK